RKHAEMLADAGVDMIFFDCSNANITWKESYTVLFKVFSQARSEGILAPQVVFLLPFGPTEGGKEMITELYTEVYKPGKYENIWFKWEGKPLIISYPDNLTEVPGDPKVSQLNKEMLDFFTFRPAQP